MAFAGPIDYSALYHDHGILQADLASAAADDVQLPGSYVQDAWDAEAVEHLNFEPDPEEEPETPPVGGTDKDDEVEDEHDAPAKRKSLVLSDEQKKQRMRDQNRRAAEKSRNKRKSELNGMEAYVNETAAENARLRAKLAAMRAAQAQPPVPPTTEQYRPLSSKTKKAIVPSEGSLGVDFSYLNKIANELHSNKKLLLQRQLELARLKGADQPESAELDDARQRLLDAEHDARVLRAEEGSIQLLLGSLQAERDTMNKTARTLAQQTEERRALALAIRRDRLTGALTSVADVDVDMDGEGVRTGVRDEAQGGALDITGEKNGETDEDLTRDAVINEIRGFMEAHGQWEAD